LNTYKQNFKGYLSFISVGKEDGKMDIAFQIECPGVNFDLSHAGKGNLMVGFSSHVIIQNKPIHLLEVNASQKDKDFIMAVNWKKAKNI
jgi:nitrous-oxide reductase